MGRIHLVSTKITHTRCPHCRAHILVALDNGIPARVDPTPLLNRTAEIAALLAGRWTYELHLGELMHRDAARIHANNTRGTIHADHQCKKGK